MASNRAKEYTAVLVITLMTAALGLYLSNRHDKLVVEKPRQEIALKIADYTFQTSRGPVTVTESSYKEITALYPRGKTLGMSTVYRPDDVNLLFTFTEDSNILTKLDIKTPSAITARNVKVGDSFDQVVKAYGSNYRKSYLSKSPEVFDVAYGKDNYLVFKINRGIVDKIVFDSALK